MKNRTRAKFEKHNRNVKNLRTQVRNICEKVAKKGIVINDPTDVRSVIEAGKKYIGITSTSIPETFKELRDILQTIEVMSAKPPLRDTSEPAEDTSTKWQEVYYAPEGENTKTASDKLTRFYASYEWRRARYATLKRYGFRCLACGRSAKQGAVIQVDHKKPLRYHWDLRLDLDNLQPLCDWCNHGKGNWDTTDFTS